MSYNKNEYFIEEDGSHNYDKRPDGSWKLGLSPGAKSTHFKPGNKSGGRPKGSKNKKTLRQELADKPGLSPAEFLYSVMNDENCNAGQRLTAAKELMGYTEPKLASIEMHTDEENKSPFNVFINTTPEEVTEEASEDNEDTPKDD